MRLGYLIPLFLTSVPALANVSSDLGAIEIKLKACIAKNETTVGQNECNTIALNAADKVLTGIYRTTVERLKRSKPSESADEAKEKLTRLIASERAWVAFKETDCKLQGVTMLGGSGESMIIGGSLYRMTTERAKSIDDIFADH